MVMYVVVDDPVDTTACEGDSGTFTCVFFIPSGIPQAPGWLRNDAAVDMMHHTVTSNLTGGTSAPAYIRSIITVSNVTVSDDDGVSYQCGFSSAISSGATLNVVGMCIFHNLIIYNVCIYVCIKRILYVKVKAKTVLIHHTELLPVLLYIAERKMIDFGNRKILRNI